MRANSPKTNQLLDDDRKEDCMMVDIVLMLALQQQQSTVAVTLAPDQPAVIMSLKDAEAKFKQLCADGTDDQQLKALAVALNPMPDWPQMVMNNDASVCNRSPRPLPIVPLK